MARRARLYPPKDEAFMTQLTEIAPSAIRQNPFQAVGRQWMLITAGAPGAFNTMTASWGTWGHLWNRDVAICFVRPQRYTYEFIERSTVYTLSFFDGAWKQALEYCGSHSGREVDKIAETGLTPFTTPGGAVSFEQAHLVLECRKLYADNLVPAGFLDPGFNDEFYPEGDHHRFYVGEIIRVLAR
jgi:flavin reductase (DIM6/NTAB) family NADH-FMN oxidoreductase RutF